MSHKSDYLKLKIHSKSQIRYRIQDGNDMTCKMMPERGQCWMMEFGTPKDSE